MTAEPLPGASVWEAFAAAADRWPERPFLNVLPETAAHLGVAAGELSYATVGRAAAARAAAWRAAGLARGSRVMVRLGNRPATVVEFLALNACGAAFVPVNPDLRAAELAHMARLARPAAAVVLPGEGEDLAGAAGAAGLALGLATAEAPPPAVAAGAAAAGAADGEEAEAAMLFTSGTTGAAKGCVLSNFYFLDAGRWYAGAGGLCALTDGARMLTPLPLFHMNALACSLMGVIAVGGCLTLLDRFHPSSWWASVAAARAEVVHYLGVMPAMLMKLPPAPEERAHAVRFGFGAGVPHDLHAPFEARFGFPLIEGWAMTETGCGVCIVANAEPRHVGSGAFGRPGPAVEVRILRDDGSDAAPGEAGELLIRRAGADPRRGFFTRYEGMPEETEAAWAGGWFHTGDVVRQGPDGTLFFVDRKKNVIRRSGENIAAVEVEATLLRAPGVRAAGVAAVPDALRGEEVMACLVAEGPADRAAAEGIARWMLGEVAYYKVPGWIAFVEALPVTATQKIQRGELRALAARLLAEGRAHDLRELKRRTAA